MDGTDTRTDAGHVASTMHALTPEALLRLVRLERAGPYAVRGYARNLKMFPAATPTHCYGDLALPGASIKFRVPLHSAPPEGAAVVIRGTLGLSRLNEVLLYGDVDAGWTPTKAIGARLQARPRNRPPVSLYDFLGRHTYMRLGFLVTETAWGDLLSTVGTDIDLTRCTALTPGFTYPAAFAGAIQRLCDDRNVGAIVIACGGNPRLGEIGNSETVLDALLACGRPFYVAMGHAHDALAIDMHADERFAMPGDFGHKLQRGVERVEFARRQAITFRKNEEQLANARSRIAALEQQLVAATVTPSKSGSAFSWEKLFGIVGVTILLAWLLAQALS